MCYSKRNQVKVEKTEKRRVKRNWTWRLGKLQFCITQNWTQTVLISKHQLFLPKYSSAVRLSYHHGDWEDVKWTARFWEVILTSHTYTWLRFLSHLYHNNCTLTPTHTHTTSWYVTQIDHTRRLYSWHRPHLTTPTMWTHKDTLSKSLSHSQKHLQPLTLTHPHIYWPKHTGWYTVYDLLSHT